eukprot:466198-Prorocentrum_minimum.AAC.21
MLEYEVVPHRLDALLRGHAQGLVVHGDLHVAHGRRGERGPESPELGDQSAPRAFRHVHIENENENKNERYA